LLLRRDTVSIGHANISSELLTKNSNLSRLEVENLLLMQENKDLAQEIISLAAEAKAWRKEDVTDPKLRAQLDRMERELKVKKTRWQIMKNVMSGVIVGSGIDWAGDDELVQLVVDAEEED
jgi:uncharacterized protein (UPF0335 family)